MRLKYLFALVLLVLALPDTSHANHVVGHNGVIAINEWNSGNSGPYPLWNWHNGNVYTTPQSGCPASPSGGGSIRGNFAAGTYSSSNAGGSSSYVVPANVQITTLYFGHWLCFSSPFAFHPIGTKFNFMTQRFASGGPINPTGKENFVSNINPGGHGINITTQLYWDNCTYGNINRATQLCTIGWFENRGHVEIVPGRWYWMEVRATMNTVGNGYASSHDGILQAWIDDTLVIEYFDVPFRMTSNNVWHDLANTPILGGGGTWSYGTHQYMYYDHNVISTQRIGRPGGTPTGETIPPLPPVITATAQVGAAAINLSWTLVTDASGIANNTIRWCLVVSGGVCTPTNTLGVFGPGTLSTVHTGLANASTYGYCGVATDASPNSNQSGCSTPTKYATTPSPSAPPPPPTITSVSVTSTTVSIVNGPVVATTVRLHYGSNGGQFVVSQPFPIADFPGGTKTLTLPAGTQFFGACPIDASGVETPSGCRYVGVGPPTIAAVDTTPIVMTQPLPSATQPSGTTTVTYSVHIDKPGNCRADTTAKDYVDMDIETTAVQMTVSNLTASFPLTGRTDGSSVDRFIQCEFINTYNQSYYTTTAQQVTIAVAAAPTGDITPPGPVLNPVAESIPNTSNIRVTWDALLDALYYKIYISAGTCSSYVFSGRQPSVNTDLLTLSPNTAHCIKITGVDASENEDQLESATEVTAMAGSIPDVDPPTIVKNLRVKNRFSGSLEFEWDVTSDAQGPVQTELLYCIVGTTCPNFTAAPARSGSTSLVLTLTPGLSYDVKAISYDAAGNPSGGIGTPVYSNVVRETTEVTGIGQTRPDLPFGATRDTPVRSQVPIQRPMRPAQ